MVAAAARWPNRSLRSAFTSYSRASSTISRIANSTRKASALRIRVISAFSDSAAAVRSAIRTALSCELPAAKELAGFDFAASAVNEPLIREVAMGGFLEAILRGSPESNTQPTRRGAAQDLIGVPTIRRADARSRGTAPTHERRRAGYAWLAGTPKGVSAEQIARMERKMASLQRGIKRIEGPSAPTISIWCWASGTWSRSSPTQRSIATSRSITPKYGTSWSGLARPRRWYRKPPNSAGSEASADRPVRHRGGATADFDGDLDPTSAGTTGNAALWDGSSAAVRIAANPFEAHQADRRRAGLPP